MTAQTPNLPDTTGATFERAWAAIERLSANTDAAIAKTDAAIAKSRAESETAIAKSRAETEAAIAKSRAESDAAMKKIREETEAIIAKSRAETEREMQITQRTLNQAFGDFGRKLGKVAECFFAADISGKFEHLGYHFKTIVAPHIMRDHSGDISLEIDIFAENHEYALAAEIKLDFSKHDVDEHLERMAKIRLIADERGDHRKFIAAIGGALVHRSVREYAEQQGMFVLVQSGEAVKLADLPPNFHPREW